MGVTDAGVDSRSADERGNGEGLAEAEARLKLLLERLGIDASDEAQARRHREHEARRTAEMCGRCGAALGPAATVYRLRFVERGVFGAYGYRAHVLCEDCATHPPRPDSLRFWTRVCQLTDSGMSSENAYQAAIARTLVYYPCGTCGRKVVFDMTKREREGRRQHVFCSEQCARDSHRRIRNARNAKVREKVCAVCGKEFTATRRDAKTCSKACKQKAYRRRKLAEALEVDPAELVRSQ